MLPRGWPDSGSPVFWRWHRRGDKPQSGQATDLRQVPEAARGARAYVWTPAGDTVLTSATLPTRSARKIAQALPFALEDRLLGDPETLHFAYRPENDGSLSVAVTAHERLRHWTDALAQAGIKPVTLCPATPAGALGAGLLVAGIRRGRGAGAHRQRLRLRRAAVAGDTTAAVGGGPAGGSARPEDARIPGGVQCPGRFSGRVVGRAAAGTGARRKASVWEKQEEPSAPLNLLQGQFETKGQFKSSLRPYIPAAAMLLIWMLGNMAVDISDWWKLRRQHQEYTREMTSLLMSSFPETKTVLDPGGTDAAQHRHPAGAHRQP